MPDEAWRVECGRNNNVQGANVRYSTHHEIAPVMTHFLLGQGDWVVKILACFSLRDTYSSHLT
jgi:hypothetical protein